MKVLVTGSKGFIGKNLLERVPKDWVVRTYDVKSGLVRPQKLNISDCDWVIHLGAVSSTTEKNIQKVMDLNLTWSIELFEECVKHGVNLQWSSSASVYGKNCFFPMREDQELHPSNLYAMSKYLFEEYVKKRDVDNIIYQGFRYFNVYGDHEDHKGTQASPFTQFSKQARDTGVIKIFEGSERYVRDFIHVDTVVDYHLRMIDKILCGIFNVGSGNSRSFYDVAKEVATLYNARIETIPFPESLREHYQEYTCADTTKILSVLY